MAKPFTFHRVHSPLLPTNTYVVKSRVTTNAVGRVGHNAGKRGWVAHPHGATRPLPGRFYTRADAAYALMDDALTR